MPTVTCLCVQTGGASVCGPSAGGNLTAVVHQQAFKMGLPMRFAGILFPMMRSHHNPANPHSLTP